MNLSIQYVSSIAILIFLSLNSNSQDIKTYNGEFENGKAIYTYYEDSVFNRVYEGKFTLNTTRLIDEYGFSKLSIVGSFKKGLRDGKWEINAQTKSNKVKIIANYTMGVKTGNWSFEDRELNSNKIKDYSYISYKNNFRVNSFKCKGKIFTEAGTVTISGKFNDLGCLDSIWNIEIQNFDTKVSFVKVENGKLNQIVCKDKSTGSVVFKVDDNSAKDEMYNNFCMKFNQGTSHWRGHIWNENDNPLQYINQAIEFWENNYYHFNLTKIEGYKKVF